MATTHTLLLRFTDNAEDVELYQALKDSAARANRSPLPWQVGYLLKIVFGIVKPCETYLGQTGVLEWGMPSDVQFTREERSRMRMDALERGDYDHIPRRQMARILCLVPPSEQNEPTDSEVTP